jgi:hypothetical protein
VVAGVVSALFVSAVRRVAAQSRPWSIEARLVLAGVLMGGCGWLVPEVMGIGYDTVGLALNGGLALGLLTILLVGKLVATTLCIGLGVPGGVIGPTLFIGAVLGALLAGAAAATPLGGPDQVGLFALLGMGAMMSASLQAPLAALTAILELTDNPETILPGMLAVVVAGLTAKVAFGQDSLFLTMLRAGGLDYAPNPVSQALRRIGVAGVMQRRIIVLDAQLTRGRLREALKSNPVYVLVRTGEGGLQTLPAVDLVRQLGDDPGMDPEDPVDLSEVPADRLATGDIDLRASLHEAWLALEDGTVDALLVRRGRLDGPVRGVLTREAVEGAYRVA